LPKKSEARRGKGKGPGTRGFLRTIKGRRSLNTTMSWPKYHAPNLSEGASWESDHNTEKDRKKLEEASKRDKENGGRVL